MSLLGMALMRLSEAEAIVAQATRRADPMLPTLAASRRCYVSIVALLTRKSEPTLSDYDYILLEELAKRADLLVRGALGGVQ